MRISILFFIAIAVGITSCAQQQKKEEKSTAKEQTNQMVLQTVKMPVNGMVCSACQSNVKKTIKSVDGVTDVVVNLEKKQQLHTEELFWKPDTKKIFTEKFVTIKLENEILYGTGLDAAQDLSYYTIANPKGEFDVKE